MFKAAFQLYCGHGATMKLRRAWRWGQAGQIRRERHACIAGGGRTEGREGGQRGRNQAYLRHTLYTYRMRGRGWGLCGRAKSCTAAKNKRQNKTLPPKIVAQRCLGVGRRRGRGRRRTTVHRLQPSRDGAAYSGGCLAMQLPLSAGRSGTKPTLRTTAQRMAPLLRLASALGWVRAPTAQRRLRPAGCSTRSLVRQQTMG